MKGSAPTKTGSPELIKMTMTPSPTSSGPRNDYVELYRDVRTIKQPDKLMTALETIQIFFDYPLTNPVEITFYHPGGFTRRDFIDAVESGYRAIYAMEADPGTHSPLLNRATSEGPFGIVGHYIDDLDLDACWQPTEGHFRLSVLS